MKSTHGGAHTHTCTISYHRFLQSKRVIDQSSVLSIGHETDIKRWNLEKTVTRQAQKDHKTGAQAVALQDCSVVTYRRTQQSGMLWMLLMTGAFWHFILRMEKENHQHLKRRILRNAAWVVSQMRWSKAYHENVDVSTKSRTEHPLWIFPQSQTTGRYREHQKYSQSFDDYCLHLGWFFLLYRNV